MLHPLCLVKRALQYASLSDTFEQPLLQAAASMFNRGAATGGGTPLRISTRELAQSLPVEVAG